MRLKVVLTSLVGGLACLWIGAPPASAQVRISEFMAANTHSLADENGSHEDWIEIQNTSLTNVNLFDWSLTDKAGNLNKWRFPSTNLPPGGFLVVFASNKDRRTPGARLHTNFKLEAAGDYLALVDPDGNIATQFSPTYPPQVSDVSYGFSPVSSNVTLITTGAAVRVLVPSTGNGGSVLDYAWTGDVTNEPFSDGAWQSGTTGIGFTDGSGGVSPDDIGLNLQSTMLNSNASAFVRLPFVVHDPTNYSLLTLRLKYNDGYVAWINGIQVASANATLDGLAWDATATDTNSGAITNFIQIGNAGTLLREGTNILAIQGLNILSNETSFLVAPELDATTIPMESFAGVYFLIPTPGAVNVSGTTRLGSGITDVGHAPNVPLDDENLIITARVFQTLNPVSSVTLRYRIMHSSEISIQMFDDGAHGDGLAGDGVYGATIPATASTMGQMIRYFIFTQDAQTNISRWPLFRDPAGSAQYLGTMVRTNVTSKLPVFHLFISPANQGAADSQTGSRASFFYDGEFYDNIGIEVRGNTSASFSKKSHRLEFNKEHPLRHPGPGGRIRKTSVMAEFGDPSYLRSHLSFWMQDLAGVPAAFDYPVHLRLNGAFYQLAFHNDVLGEEHMERLGYDPEGALYKAAGSIQTTHYSLGIFQKLLPKTNGVLYASTADFDTMATAISSTLAAGTRRTNLCDIFNLPEIINYLAIARLCHEGDDVWANMSMHRDTYGSQEWSIVPFDLNMSWGQLYYGDNPGQYGHINATDDNYKSHPLYGGSQVQDGGGRPFNRIYDAIITVPETRQMLLRRMRTLMDTCFQPVGTPYSQDLLLQHITTMTNLIWDEARLDRVKWGWPPVGGFYGYGPNQWLTNGVRDLINQFINPRRLHFFYTHCVINTGSEVGVASYLNAGIPTAQPEKPVVSIRAFDYNPVSGNQDQEYVQLTNANPYAVDISGWKLQGGIEYTFHPGTVMPSNSALYVSPNVRAFRARTTSPRGGQGLFVQGNYSGRLNAWGESLALADTTGRLVSSNSFVGSPSPAQRYLRLTEIMYNPSPAPAITNDEQQFEYVELKNISTNVTLNLTGVRFTNGIYFNFTGSAVASLAPQQTILLVRNQAAFTTRYGNGFAIAGEFTGVLDNGSETLRLEDAGGEKILEFAYHDSWYPITDGLGFSLVIVDENAPWSTWDQKPSWRAGGNLNGSPGVTDPAPPQFHPVIVNEALTHTDLPQLDSVELYNPTTNAVNLGGWFLTDDFYTPKKYRIANGTTISSNSFLVFNENQFNTGTNAFRFSELGEFIYLFSGDANTNLTGYWHGYQFGEAPNGVSFGRYTNSQTNAFFTLQSAVTLGTSNAYPRVGPIVISEIMYHPPDTNGVDNALDEFIELQNIALTNVPLYDPASATNTWRLRNAVDFDFPTSQILNAGERLLVVGFNPANAAQLAEFRAKYGVSNTVPVFGPWDGKLDNSGETIELKQPGPPDDTVVVPYYMIDKVAYQDEAPWPISADGIGNSLQRVSNTGFGNDPTNWFAAGLTAGRATVPNQAPTVALLSPTNGATLNVPPGVELNIAANDDDGSIASVKLLDGTNVVKQWTSSPYNFTWTNPATGLHVLQAIATDNLGAIGVSTQVLAGVIAPVPPITITSPSSGVLVSSGSNVLITVDASGLGDTLESVEFFLDGNSIGQNTDPFFVWVATSGSHTLSAVAHDTLGRASAPASVSLTSQAVVQSPPMVDYTEWKYLDDGSNQGTAWTNVNFNDSAWSSGYPVLGFGNPYTSTAVRTNYITYYFRCKFVVPSLSGMTTFTYFQYRDDGAIAYLNGRELLRGNMPGGAVNYLTPAASSVSSYFGYESTTPTSSQLVVGTNILTVEVHQAAAASPDLLFYANLYLNGTWYGPAITNQPVSRSVSQGSNVTFTVGSAGTAPLTYQWYFSNQLFATTSSRTLTLTNVQSTNAGPYHVVVTNFLGTSISKVATLAVIIYDADQDGMPDAWEQANGTDLFVPDAAADPDHDSLNNLQEYLAGTSPTNAASALKIESVSLTGTNFIFSFTAVSNHSYTIQAQPIIGGAWPKLRDVTAVSSNRTIWITNSLALATNRFFRLVTPLIPPADSDGDGMSDAWEIANGTDPFQDDRTADPDHDGLNNLQEYLTGTSPTNTASVLKIETVTLSGASLVFSFTAVSNHAYVVQSKPALLDAAWQNWQDITAAPSNRILWLTNVIDPNTSRLYRVAAPVQP